jgi:charged multivesicular body protein 7
MEAFQSSTATLRNILAHPSLQRESIEQTMDALAEANADARDLDDAIRISGDVAVDLEDADVEDELQKLVREVEAAKDEQEGERRIARAPTVPTATPGLSTQQSEIPSPLAVAEPEL